MHTKRQPGFTLVELAVVIFLIGILASLGLSALNAQMASASISATKKKQETIKDALISYLGRNKRLPCPDSNVISPDGIENRGATGTPATPANTALACDKNFGIVPYQTLGLPKSAVLDGWENFFSYQVSNDATSAPNLDWTLTNSFYAGNTGVITVKDRSSADITNIVVVVIAYGKNGLGAYTSKGTRNVLPDSTAQPDEYQNTQPTAPPPPIFYNREYTENPAATGGAFDDIVVVLNPSDLITPLIKDGALKSAESQWAEQITNINNVLVGDMFLRSRCSPLGNQGNSIPEVPPATQQSRFVSLMQANGIPTVDPWGGTLTYTTGNFCRLHSDGRYKTSNCDSNCGTCLSTSIPAFTVTTTTTTPPVTIKTQMLNTLIVANPSLLNGCPSP